MAKFTDAEINVVEHHPDALRALADYHDGQESQADAMGMGSSAEHHRARRIELEREAALIEDEWTGATASDAPGVTG